MPQLLMRSLALEGIRQISLADFGKCIRSNLILWKFHSCVTIWGFLLVAHFFQKMLWNPLLICCHFRPTCKYIWAIAELLFPPFCWWDSIRTPSIYVTNFYVSETGKKGCCVHGSSVGCADKSKVLEFTNILYDALFSGGTDYKQSDKVQIQLGGAYMNLLFFSPVVIFFRSASVRFCRWSSCSFCKISQALFVLHDWKLLILERRISSYWSYLEITIEWIWIYSLQYGKKSEATYCCAG